MQEINSSENLASILKSLGKILYPAGLHCWLPVSTDLFDHCIFSFSFIAYPRLLSPLAS